MPKDELGIEYSETVAEAIKDPKSSVLKEVLDYFLRRRDTEQKIADEKIKKEELEKKPKGMFDKFGL